jgi:hypothetical protein
MPASQSPRRSPRQYAIATFINTATKLFVFDLSMAFILLIEIDVFQMQRLACSDQPMEQFNRAYG